ncbi:TetR family transcriptional regulator [Xaviernesmea oryzae]|uniref:TetR family transcriptional regulator n=1 Tax=Xaviernesmea oryzae TaxID=464029 RepID=A0A1Q9B2L4_9HYPH|nr:TetR family transcriptional regulator [Xaviernesmea oryzae]OLP62246.1 TetR family transcriptional regulator [Xaviernesmea oryzae]SEL93126.1 transcriptional regulator, TetR family [Xaviernesmea oryzae]
MRRTKAEAEETRSRIIAAAERVFYEKGVSTSSLEEVARAAGVTRGAIYWHFASKSDLFLALSDAVPMPQEDMVREDCDCSGRDVLGGLEEIVGTWIGLMAKDEQRQRVLTILLRCDYSGELAPVLEKQREITEDHDALFAGFFRRAETQGTLSASWTPESATRTLHWMVQGLVTDWLLFGRHFDLETEGRAALARLFDSFRKPAAALVGS